MQLQIKETYPLDGGKCKAENVIYKATIETDNSSKIYIGLSANQIKNAYQHTIKQIKAKQTRIITSSTNKQLNFQN